MILQYPVEYKCNCSLDKTKTLLAQLSEDEINEEINKHEGLNITCNFCQRVYHLEEEDLKEVLRLKKDNEFNVK